MIKLVSCAVLCTIVATFVHAEMSPEDQRLTEPGAYERPWVGYRTAECPVTADGTGNSPADPILVTDFYTPFDSAVVWESPERGRETNQWEKEEGLKLTADLHCKWVKISGHFRRFSYQRYRGILIDSPSSLYTRDGGPGNKIRPGAYFVENWADQDTRSALVNGADLEITAQFYDLCRVAYEERDRAGDGRIIMSGPCHYGRFTGLMLRDAKIEAVHSSPYQRAKGEINRPIIGDIREVPQAWPEFLSVKRSAIDRIETIRRGPAHYWAQVFSGYESKEERIEEYVSDPDDWISFLANDPSSPLSASRRPIEKNEFKIFRLSRYGGGETEEKINIAIACFCSTRKCGDVWPLFWEDATDFHNDYLCFDLRREYDEKTKWR